MCRAFGWSVGCKSANSRGITVEVRNTDGCGRRCSGARVGMLCEVWGFFVGDFLVLWGWCVVTAVCGRDWVCAGGTSDDLLRSRLVGWVGGGWPGGWTLEPKRQARNRDNLTTNSNNKKDNNLAQNRLVKGKLRKSGMNAINLIPQLPRNTKLNKQTGRKLDFPKKSKI